MSGWKVDIGLDLEDGQPVVTLTAWYPTPFSLGDPPQIKVSGPSIAEAERALVRELAEREKKR